MDIVMRAGIFAREMHKGQKRKYTGEDYIYHSIEVMQIVKSVSHTQEMLAAALLHDVVEDCGVKIETISSLFGAGVASMVNDLSDISVLEDGNRATRKAIDRDWISWAGKHSKTIKLADLISNSKSIVEHDKEFAKVYIKEKELLLEVLTEGDATLYAQAKELIEKAKEELGID